MPAEHRAQDGLGDREVPYLRPVTRADDTTSPRPAPRPWLADSGPCLAPAPGHTRLLTAGNRGAAEHSLHAAQPPAHRAQDTGRGSACPARGRAHFHFASRSVTRTLRLAQLLDSLVRVSRRVGWITDPWLAASGSSRSRLAVIVARGPLFGTTHGHHPGTEARATSPSWPSGPPQRVAAPDYWREN